MSIDWFTFTAQVVNFLILVALLRWFLYGPIVRAMQQREEKIAARFEEAERMQREAGERAEQYRHKVHDIDQRREGLLREAHEEAEQQHQRLTTAAREQVRRERDEWYAALNREQLELLAELQTQASQFSAEVARCTLTQLADVSLEQQMFSTFIERLQQLEDPRREEIKNLLTNGQEEVTLRSAFEVPQTWRDRFRNVVRNEFQHEGEIEFDTSPDLICGIELQVGGYGFGWNVKDFLRNIELQFDGRLKAGTTGAVKT